MLNLNVITHNPKHLLNSYNNDDNGNEGKLKTPKLKFILLATLGKNSLGPF
jgi:hypothetical protein